MVSHFIISRGSCWIAPMISYSLTLREMCVLATKGTTGTQPKAIAIGIDVLPIASYFCIRDRVCAVRAKESFILFLSCNCPLYNPALINPVSGSLVITAPHVTIYLPPSLACHLGTGNSSRLTSSPTSITSLHGPLLTSTGEMRCRHLSFNILEASIGSVSSGNPKAIANLRKEVNSVFISSSLPCVSR